MKRKSTSLRRNSDFDAVYKHARATGDRILVVRVRPRHDAANEPARIGFVTTKALGNAVARNRVKRRLRAIAAGSDIMDGLDIVVSARKPAVDQSFEALARSLRTLLDRAGALKK